MSLGLHDHWLTVVESQGYVVDERQLISAWAPTRRKGKCSATELSHRLLRDLDLIRSGYDSAVVGYSDKLALVLSLSNDRTARRAGRPSLHAD